MMKQLRRILPFLAVLAAIPLTLILLSGLLGKRVSEEQLSLARDALRRAAVECYALEGFYPDDASYLISRYGVAVDETRFYIHYQYIASNLMPDITVIPID